MILKTPDAFKNKTALVTGASRGIGKALALALAERGAHVLALARNKQKLEELDDLIKSKKGRSTLIPCDLRQQNTIEELSHLIEQRWGKLDILVINAAILGPLTPIIDLDEQELYNVFAINSFASWRLMRAFNTLLQKAAAGRALVLSSSVAHKIKPYWAAYGASKAALEIFARSWAEEVKHSNLRINIVNPGGTRTDMRAQAMPGEDPLTLPSAEEIAEKILPLLSEDFLETGQLYDYRQNSLMEYIIPQPKLNN